MFFKRVRFDKSFKEKEELFEGIGFVKKIIVA
jgi:hypothetical protein